MNHDTTACAFPALTSDVLGNSDRLIDNLFADLWKQVGMKALLQRCGFHKRSPDQVVCKEMDVCALYQCAVRGQWEKVAGQSA